MCEGDKILWKERKRRAEQGRWGPGSCPSSGLWFLQAWLTGPAGPSRSMGPSLTTGHSPTTGPSPHSECRPIISVGVTILICPPVGFSSNLQVAWY